MRNLILILLLANLALLAWQHWVRVPEPSEPRVMRDVPLLEVVRGGAAPPADRSARVAEVDGRALRSSPDDDGVAPPVSVPEPAPRCVALGPFSELDTASAAAARLRADAGVAARQRAADGDVWIGYWVQLNHEQRERADAEVARLRAGGIADAYRIPGDDGHTVSLGVFSTRVRANRLRDQARELGADPVVQDRFRSGTVYWLDFVLPPALELQPQDFVAEGPPPRLEPAVCPND